MDNGCLKVSNTPLHPIQESAKLFSTFVRNLPTVVQEEGEDSSAW